MIDLGGILEPGVPENAEARPPKPPRRAHLYQCDPELGLRGWEICVFDWVWTPGYREDGSGAWVNDRDSTPRTPLQKPGLRPPTMAQRRAALARLGFEPDEQDDAVADLFSREWEWRESEWPGERPYLWAVLQVRPVAPEVTG